MIREAINELKKYTLGKKNTETVEINVLHLNRVIKALEQTRWIPVTERLPESDEEYHTFLVTDRKGKVTLSEFYLSIKDKKPYWSGMIDVIAWMPLPEPYKAESEDKE
jgi:Protein of unknown function (DUF551).